MTTLEPVSSPPKIAPPNRRWIAWLAVVTVFTILLAGGLGWFYQQQQARDIRQNKAFAVRVCEDVQELRDQLIRASAPIPEIHNYLLIQLPPSDCAHA